MLPTLLALFVKCLLKPTAVSHIVLLLRTGSQLLQSNILKVMLVLSQNRKQQRIVLSLTYLKRNTDLV